jgi:hypothetical protein
MRDEDREKNTGTGAIVSKEPPGISSTRSLKAAHRILSKAIKDHEEAVGKGRVNRDGGTGWGDRGF